MTFDLRDEAWIPVIRTDGSAREVSLRDAFKQAKEIRRIACELPTQSFAILRLLLAIEHDAVGYHRLDDVSRAIADGPDVAAVMAYLDEFDDRFDLFHPTRPFYQVATLRSAKGEVSGLEKLIADVPNGSPFMTTRGGAALQRISAAEAAVWLVHVQAFDPSGIRTGAVGDAEVKGGKGYPIGPAWAGQIGGLVLHGQTLAQTLVYNLVPTPREAADRPVWTLPVPQTEQRQLDARPAGPVQVLAWQSRRVRLVGEQDGVTGVLICQGDKLTPQNRQACEHMTAWRYSKPQSKKFGIPVYMPLKHDPERDSWRGLPNLISDSPEVVEGQIATLQARTVETLGSQEDDLAATIDSITLEIVGINYGPQEATVDELVNDSLDLRVALLGSKSGEVRESLHQCIRTADDAVRQVGVLAANIARAAGDHDGTDGALNTAKVEAWAALDAPARDWLATLSADTDTIDMKRQFQQFANRVLLQQASGIADRCSPVAVVGRATSYGFMTAGKAEAIFRHSLRKLLPLAYPKTDEKETNNE